MIVVGDICWDEAKLMIPVLTIGSVESKTNLDAPQTVE
jgi:hypothetical protein